MLEVDDSEPLLNAPRVVLLHSIVEALRVHDPDSTCLPLGELQLLQRSVLRFQGRSTCLLASTF